MLHNRERIWCISVNGRSFIKFMKLSIIKILYLKIQPVFFIKLKRLNSAEVSRQNKHWREKKAISTRQGISLCLDRNPKATHAEIMDSYTECIEIVVRPRLHHMYIICAEPPIPLHPNSSCTTNDPSSLWPQTGFA